MATIYTFLAGNQHDGRETTWRTCATPSPEIPSGLSDRTADAWESLFAIADLAGGDWPQRARKAALALSGEHVVEDDNIGTMLLLRHLRHL